MRVLLELDGHKFGSFLQGSPSRAQNGVSGKFLLIFLHLIFSGKLKIAEVASRFQNVKNFIAALGKMGFQLKRKVLF